jgi:hypothetical protein
VPATQKGDFLTSVDNKTVSNVLSRLRTGVEVKTRTRFLRTYPDSFVGSHISRTHAHARSRTRTTYVTFNALNVVAVLAISSGGEAVSWMIDHIFTQTREEAVWVGQMLLNHGALQHASLQGAPFADGRQFYQFLVRAGLMLARSRFSVAPTMRAVNAPHHSQQPEAYATNRSGFLGIKYDSASPYRLRYYPASR